MQGAMGTSGGRGVMNLTPDSMTQRSGRGRGRGNLSSIAGNTNVGHNSSAVNYMDFVPFFSGDDHSEMSVRAYFNIISEISEEASWTPLVTRLLLKSRLKGRAARFYASNTRIRQASSLSDIAKIMIEKFSDDSNESSELLDFINCRQLKDESVLDFAARLESLRDSINHHPYDSDGNHIGEADVLKTFQQGLSPYINDKLISFEVNSIEDCIKSAVRIEKHIKASERRDKKILAIQRDSVLSANRESEQERDSAHRDQYHYSVVNELSDDMLDLKIEDSSQHCQGDGRVSLSNRELKSSSYTVTKEEKANERQSRAKMATSEIPALGMNKKNFFDTSHKTDAFKSSLNEGAKLLVYVFIAGRQVPVLVDSASDVSMIAREYIEVLGFQRHVWQGEMSQVIGTNNSVIRSDRFIDLRFKYCNNDDMFCHTFNVVKREEILGYNLIMGSDYIISNRGIIDMDRGEFRVRGNTSVPIKIVKSSSQTSAIMNLILGKGYGKVKHYEDDKMNSHVGKSPSIPLIGNQVHNTEDLPRDKMTITRPNWKDHEAVRSLIRYAEDYGEEMVTPFGKVNNKMSRIKELSCHLKSNNPLKGKLDTLTSKFKDVFAISTLELGEIVGWDHQVRLTKEVPIKVKQFSTPVALRGKLAVKLKTYLEAGIIEPSTSPWNSPLIVKAKKTGGVRLVLDAKAVNSVTVGIDYPMVEIKNVLAKIGGNKFFSILDLESGYHQVRLTQDSRQLFAFRTPWGKFQFVRLPMGATNSGLHFQRVMEDVLSEILGDEVHVFQDDILIATMTEDRHLFLLEKVLTAFQCRGVSVKLDKCSLLANRVKFLGHSIDENGFTMCKENVLSIIESKSPRDKTAVRRFLGKIRFYSRFIPDLTNRIENIQTLLKGKGRKIGWNEKAEEDFKEIKRIVSSFPILGFPDYSSPFRLSVGSNQISIVASLEQLIGGVVKPLGFYSRTLRRAETNYSVIEKESLAIIDSLAHFKHIVHGLPTIIISSHNALEYLRALREGNSRVTGWISRMLDFSPSFVRKGGKDDIYNGILLQDVIQAEESREKDCSVVDHVKVPVIYTDGSCIKNGKEGAKAGIGVFIKGDNSITMSREVEGRQSNNRAELLAAITAMESAVRKGHSEIIIKSDSKYLIDNVINNLDRWVKRGFTNCRNKGIVNGDEFRRIHQLLKKIKVNWVFVRGHKGEPGNTQADILASEASRIDLHPHPVTLINRESGTSMGLVSDLRVSSGDNHKGSFPEKGVLTYIDNNGRVKVNGTIRVRNSSILLQGVPYIYPGQRDSLILETLGNISIKDLSMETIMKQVSEKGFWANVRGDIKRCVQKIFNNSGVPYRVRPQINASSLNNKETTRVIKVNLQKGEK